MRLKSQAHSELKLCLMSDDVVAGLAGQRSKEGYNLQRMLEILTAQGVEVKLCKTGSDARGINKLALVDGVANDG
ncbi:hypothetical protein Xkoz_02682 [Xenorhabdus kozodoii]|uniref:Uncharacterized protein n=1 Tax=Xenorhabdus kozodoii TaxID=351676 RepID=A0A2D0L860_9GAMM|nr:hypothetical protein Xkoz_02682 [Xenorhabdus kozodoii]